MCTRAWASTRVLVDMSRCKGTRGHKSTHCHMQHINHPKSCPPSLQECKGMNKEAHSCPCTCLSPCVCMHPCVYSCPYAHLYPQVHLWLAPTFIYITHQPISILPHNPCECKSGWSCKNNILVSPLPLSINTWVLVVLVFGYEQGTSECILAPPLNVSIKSSALSVPTISECPHY